MLRRTLSALALRGVRPVAPQVAGRWLLPRATAARPLNLLQPTLLARALSSRGIDGGSGSSSAGFTAAGSFSSVLSGGESRGMREQRLAGLRPNRGGKMRKAQAGVIHIANGWNNTNVTISDIDYNVKGWCSGGSVGFKKSKRSTAFAQEKVLEEAFKKARGVRRPRPHEAS